MFALRADTFGNIKCQYGFRHASTNVRTYRLRAQVMKIITKAKANPRPRMIPYPKPCPRGGENSTTLPAMVFLFS